MIKHFFSIAYKALVGDRFGTGSRQLRGRRPKLRTYLERGTLRVRSRKGTGILNALKGKFFIRWTIVSWKQICYWGVKEIFFCSTKKGIVRELFGKFLERPKRFLLSVHGKEQGEWGYCATTVVDVECCSELLLLCFLGMQEKKKYLKGGKKKSSVRVKGLQFLGQIPKRLIKGGFFLYRHCI